MPITDPVLIHVLNADTMEPVAVRWREGGLVVALDQHNATQQYASGTCAASGDNTLVAAPGSGYQIAVSKIWLQTQTANATTALLKWGTTEIGGGLFNTQYGWLIVDFNAPDRLVGGDNQALLLNLSGANSFRYMVMYYVEAV